MNKRADDSWIYDKIAGIDRVASQPALDLSPRLRREDAALPELPKLKSAVRQALKLEPGLTVMLITRAAHDIDMRRVAAEAGMIKPKSVTVTRGLELALSQSPSPKSFTVRAIDGALRGVSSVTGLSSAESSVTASLVCAWGRVANELSRGVTSPMYIESVDSRLDEQSVAAACCDIAALTAAVGATVIVTSLSRAALIKTARLYELTWVSEVGHVISEIAV